MSVLPPESSTMSRRTVLRTLGALGALPFAGYGVSQLFSDAQAATTTASNSLACVLAPIMTEGPYWIDEHLNRSDITTDTTRSSVLQGVPFTLTLNIFKSTATSCNIAQGIQIDIWHADTIGEYSDVSGNGQTSTVGQSFLRGYQVTDASGVVTFKTIYPGWYQGRTPHVHVRARLFDAAGNTTYNFTTQIFFDEAVTDAVYAKAPYNSRGERDTRNATDMHYNSSADSINMVLALTATPDGGYSSSLNIGLAETSNTASSSFTQPTNTGTTPAPSGTPPNRGQFAAQATASGTSNQLTLSSVVTVAPQDVGISGSLFIAAVVGTTWYVNDGSEWIRYTGEFLPFTTTTLANTHTLNIFVDSDVSALCGAQIYTGYGKTAQDMLQKTQYKQVYTICQS